MNTFLQISTTFIKFVNNYLFEISIAVFIIIIFAVIFNLRLQKRDKRKEKAAKIEKSDEIIRQGLQASFKQAKRKLIEQKLITVENKDKEKEKESETLKQVMKVIQDRQDLFPESSMDDIKQQLNLYRIE